MMGEAKRNKKRGPSSFSFFGVKKFILAKISSNSLCVGREKIIGTVKEAR
jgi:hypothetical protein